jgi:hypothetical protein
MNIAVDASIVPVYCGMKFAGFARSVPTKYMQVLCHSVYHLNSFYYMVFNLHIVHIGIERAGFFQYIF